MASLSNSTDQANTSAASGNVAVVIAAYNSQDSIGEAVRSALLQEEAGEVIVVDDCSTDFTARAARAADDGSGRLKVLICRQNMGPSAARNLALKHSVSPLIAVLDADDFYLPGRLGALISHSGWDFIADNIAFVDEGASSSTFREIGDRPRFEAFGLEVHGFVTRNISRRGRPRQELGFMKPVIRRDFLVEHSLGYREDLRFGEDYDLYLRMLMAGARLVIADHVGYVARVRAGSLSGHHRTSDLGLIAAIDRAALASGELGIHDRRALMLHERHVRHKFWHRTFLDECELFGRGRALLKLLRRPAHWRAVTWSVMSDKLWRSPTGLHARFLIE